MKRVQNMTRAELRAESQFITMRLAESYQAGSDGLSYEEAEAQSMWEIDQARRRDDINDELARIKRGDVEVSTLIVWHEGEELAVVEVSPARVDGYRVSPQELQERGRALRHGNPAIPVTFICAQADAPEEWARLVEEAR